MSTLEPDLERGDGALKVPGHPFAPSSPVLKHMTPANGTPQQQPIGNPLINGTKPHPQSLPRHNRQSQHRPLSRVTPDPDAIPPKLQKLRTVIGISTSDSLATASSANPFRRPAPNVGIYARIVAEEKQARFEFYFAASVINTCYFGQIVVAAALTALGASSSSHIAITVLGATNTVIAGILTYLKGQGLPNRLRQYWNGLRKCREFIEEKERECAAEGWDREFDHPHGMDVEREIDVIVKMYHDVRQTAEDNTPDTYLPMQGNSANLLARAGGANTTTTTPAATGTEKPNGSSVNGSVGYPEEDETYESDAQGDQVYADGGALQPDTTLTPPSQPHTSAAMTPAILTGQGSSAAGKLTGK